jgi:hypothetical protein
MGTSGQLRMVVSMLGYVAFGSLLIVAGYWRTNYALVLAGILALLGGFGDELRQSWGLFLILASSAILVMHSLHRLLTDGFSWLRVLSLSGCAAAFLGAEYWVWHRRKKGWR